MSANLNCYRFPIQDLDENLNALGWNLASIKSKDLVGVTVVILETYISWSILGL
jgi:hypothetical protein